MELQPVKAEDLYNIFTDKAKEHCDLMGIGALNLCEQIISAEEKRIPVHSEIIEENLYLYHLDPPVTLVINDNPRMVIGVVNTPERMIGYLQYLQHCERLNNIKTQ